MEEQSYFTNLIKAGLEDKVDSRDPSLISMSSIGHCARQLAYRVHGIEGKPLTWRAQMIFNDGDWTHTQLRSMLFQSLKKAGSCFTLCKEEADVEFSGVSGHIDGVLEHNKDCTLTGPDHVSMLLEVKSMNDRAFCELKKEHQIPWEYRCQVSGYLAASGMQHAIIIAKNKNTGDLAEYRYTIERDLLVNRMVVIDTIASSDDPEEVARDYEPNNRGNLPWQCNYCPFVSLCWRDYELQEKKGRKFQINYKMYQTGKAIDNDKKAEAPTE